jgi:PAS domain-containing protein
MSVNEKMYELCNFNSNEFSFPVEKWIEQLSIDNKEQTVEYIKNSINDPSKTEISFEYTISNNKHTILSKGKIQRDNSQNPIRIYGINIDITDQKKYEKNLIDILNNTKTFIDQAPTALAMLDENLNYLAVSKQWYSDYNIPFQNIVGFNHYDVFP